jgi:hypothetical protein
MLYILNPIIHDMLIDYKWLDECSYCKIYFLIFLVTNFKMNLFTPCTYFESINI